MNKKRSTWKIKKQKPFFVTKTVAGSKTFSSTSDLKPECLFTKKRLQQALAQKCATIPAHEKNEIFWIFQKQAFRTHSTKAKKVIDF